MSRKPFGGGGGLRVDHVRVRGRQLRASLRYIVPPTNQLSHPPPPAIELCPQGGRGRGLFFIVGNRERLPPRRVSIYRQDLKKIPFFDRTDGVRKCHSRTIGSHASAHKKIQIHESDLKSYGKLMHVCYTVSSKGGERK